MQNTNEQLEKLSNNFLQSATEMNDLMLESMQAVLQSVSIMTQGYSELCNNCSSLSQKYLEQSVNNSKSMMNVSSVNDLMNPQNSVLKENFESLVSDMSNITQLSTSIAQKAVEPVANQLNKSISTISQKASQNTKAA